MQRFSTPMDGVIAHPKPGEREVRYREPRDRTMNHPLKEDKHG